MTFYTNIYSESPPPQINGVFTSLSTTADLVRCNLSIREDGVIYGNSTCSSESISITVSVCNTKYCTESNGFQIKYSGK